MQRLGFDARIRERLVAPDWVPAVAQGAIAVETRIEDTAARALVGVLDHASTRRCVESERAMNRTLHGSCQVPIGGFAVEHRGELRLLGLVGDAAGRIVRAEAAGDDGQALGRCVAEKLLAAGAAELLGR